MRGVEVGPYTFRMDNHGRAGGDVLAPLRRDAGGPPVRRAPAVRSAALPAPPA